jgi:hypothetical protein
MDNSVIQNPELSWAAKGLLAYLLSLPTDWETHLTELFTRSASKRTATEAAMNELLKARHIIKKRTGNNRADTKYLVFESPQKQ